MTPPALHPDNRIAFTEVFRPPAGYRLEAGIGTTYSLEFETFTALLLGFAGAEFPDPATDAATAMAALAGLRKHLRVFVNAGGLGTSKSEASRLYALYDAVLRPVRLSGAAFHPKVWVLQFVPHSRPEHRRGEDIYRFVCGSRNVTSSSCWELAVCLDGKPGEKNQFSSDLAAYLRRIPENRRDLPRSVSGLLELLPRVEFDPPQGAHDGFQFLGQWPGVGPLHRRLPARIDRALVMSPFLRGGLLESLVARCLELTIVSQQEELDALPDEVKARLGYADLFVVTGDEAMDTPGLDLHAKLVIVETDDRSEALLGSANATAAAWAYECRGNAEAMVAMSPGPSVKTVRRSFIENEKGGLRGWIQRYEPQPIDEEAREADADFRTAQMVISSLPLVALYDSAALRFTVKARSANGGALPSKVEAEVAPFLPAHDRRWQPFSTLGGRGIILEDVPVAHVSAFLVVRMHRNDRQREFVVQCDLEMSDDAAEQRQTAITTAILEGTDVRRVLLNVLQDLPAGSGASRDGGVLPMRETGGRPLLEYLSIERVMEACTSDPGKCDQIDAVLAGVQADPEVVAFQAFWREFRRALVEAGGV